MSVPNALILTPVRFAATAYVLRVTIGGTTSDLNFPSTGTLTVGRDYFMSDDAQTDAVSSYDNGHGDLIRMLRNTIRTHANGASALCSLDADYKVLVTYGGGVSGSILWSHANTTLDQAVFGFADASTASATTATSEDIPQGIYRPGRPISDDSRDRQGIVGGIGRSMSNKIRVSRYGLPAKERMISFQYLTQDVVLTEYADSAGPTNTLEYAWINSISLGQFFRLYEDESSRTSTSYHLYQISNLEDAATRSENFRVYWDRPIESVLVEVPV